MTIKNNKQEKITFEATDTLGLLYKDGKYFKELRREGPKINFIEIDPKEYDFRIQALTNKLIKCPGVDLSIILRDALYDMSLSQLDKMEKDINKEIELAEARKTEPNIKTKVRERGTCVTLVCDGLYQMTIRE